LLWPKKASAAEVIPPPGVRPAPVPVPIPAPLPTAAVPAEPLADATLNPGEQLGRILGSGVYVRATPADNGQRLATLPKGASVAVTGPVTAPTANAPQGWLPGRTSQGRVGYTAAQYIDNSGGFQAGAAATAGLTRSRKPKVFLPRTRVPRASDNLIRKPGLRTAFRG